MIVWIAGFRPQGGRLSPALDDELLGDGAVEGGGVAPGAQFAYLGAGVVELHALQAEATVFARGNSTFCSVLVQYLFSICSVLVQ